MNPLPPNTIHPLDLETWRLWLRDNHASAEEVWMVSYKRPTGQPRVEYEAAEEALCWGWIDQAKAPETQARRIAQAVRGSQQNLRMDQWKSKETT